MKQITLLMMAALTLVACVEDPDQPCASQTWYQDADNDGLGNPDVSLSDCEQPTGYVANADDDNDVCAENVDECGVCGGTGAPTWYADTDEDGLGDPQNTLSDCEQPSGYVANADDADDTVDDNLSPIERAFAGRIDLSNLLNYANQAVPNYITRDNTDRNEITDAGATLGCVLFYDKSLSVDNTIACASCHKQKEGFGDRSLASTGVAGTTGRHSMRLINARFGDETRFFWDERAMSLESQTTMPIQDHVEMGFSGQDGDPGINELIVKLEDIDYYEELFTFVYGDAAITEARMQDALAQFVRSIQSFDSRFDAGLTARNGNLAANFPNFTAEENLGKTLFLTPPGGPNGGGAGCAGCHQPPEFSIDPASLNNGVIGVIGDPELADVTVTRTPTLRDMIDPFGNLNGALMHDGSLTTLRDVIDHYNDISIDQANTNLDPRLSGAAPGPGNPPGQGQNLDLTEGEKDALVAFLETLGGTNVYTDERWSDPFRN